jgi:hypothetical protein
MSLLVASLYLLCIAFLFGSALYVYSRNPFSRLNSAYALLALTLLGWVGTLFVFTAQTGGLALLWLGRANFAAAALAAPAVLGFVHELRREPSPRMRWLWIEALSVALIALLTGLVDRSESLQVSVHVTDYGAFFPIYVINILAFVSVALWRAFAPTPHLSTQTRLQLRLVGVGVFATVTVGTIANAILPYVYGDFRYIDAGTLSTIFFLAAVAYAAVVYRLFNLQVVVRTTLIFGVLIAFALEIYQVAIEFLTRLLPLGDPAQQHAAAVTVALIINAFTHEPLRRWLEQLADQLLTGKRPRHESRSIRRQ